MKNIQGLFRKNYGTPLVVFDGYKTPSTKDMTHMKRKKGVSGVEVTFSIDTVLVISKDMFLSNERNKEKLHVDLECNR